MTLPSSSGITVDFTGLTAGTRVDVETSNRRYRIECLGGTAIRISGHPHYCPTPVLARLHGSLTPEGFLEFGLIGQGRRMLFFLDRQPVTTSMVVRVRVQPA